MYVELKQFWLLVTVLEYFSLLTESLDMLLILKHKLIYKTTDLQ